MVGERGPEEVIGELSRGTKVGVDGNEGTGSSVCRCSIIKFESNTVMGLNFRVTKG